MIKVRDIMSSKEYKSIHPTAKKILDVQLPALESKAFLEDSDLASIQFLIANTDAFYKMKDEVKDNFTVDVKGHLLSNPLLKEMSCLQRQTLAILNTLGGSTKSRRSLNSKDLARGEETALDGLLHNGIDDDL